MEQLKIIAHRLGFQMTPFPENSIEAINYIFLNENILEFCDGFEFDIQFTKDHIPIVTHDNKIDFITKYSGKIGDYTLKELKKIKFGFRNGKTSSEHNYEFLTLEELLLFFVKNKKLLNKKIIKIESKSKFNKKNAEVFINVMNKFSILKNNIIHLSYNPYNLMYIKFLQKLKGFYVNSTDLLCDFKLTLFIFPKLCKPNNISIKLVTKFTKVNEYNNFIINFKNKLPYYTKAATNLKSLSKVLKKYNNIGIYTINIKEEIYYLEELLEKIEFITKNNIYITSDNPQKIKNIINKKE